MTIDLFNQPSATSGYNVSHHNSNNESGDRLQEAEKKARSLETIILGVLEPGKLYTPWEVHELLDRSSLIGSIRRAMTNLTTKELLVKTKETTIVKDTNAQNYKWRLATSEDSLTSNSEEVHRKEEGKSEL